MEFVQEAETVGIRACYACGGGLLEHDRYCRWCSVRQVEPTLRVASGAIDLMDSTSKFDTSPLDQSRVRSDLHRPVSGPLVRFLAEGVSSKPSLVESGRATRAVVAALVALPVWLIIILLSPLDAYFVSRTIANRV